jgi:hypothetical protein
LQSHRRSFLDTNIWFKRGDRSQPAVCCLLRDLFRVGSAPDISARLGSEQGGRYGAAGALKDAPCPRPRNAHVGGYHGQRLALEDAPPRDLTIRLPESVDEHAHALGLALLVNKRLRRRELGPGVGWVGRDQDEVATARKLPASFERRIDRATELEISVLRDAGEAQQLMDAPREARHLAQAIKDRSLNPLVSEPAKISATAGIEAFSRLKQADKAELDQIVELHHVG